MYVYFLLSSVYDYGCLTKLEESTYSTLYEMEKLNLSKHEDTKDVDYVALFGDRCTSLNGNRRDKSSSNYKTAECNNDCCIREKNKSLQKKNYDLQAKFDDLLRKYKKLKKEESYNTMAINNNKNLSKNNKSAVSLLEGRKTPPINSVAKKASSKNNFILTAINLWLMNHSTAALSYIDLNALPFSEITCIRLRANGNYSRTDKEVKDV